MTTKKPITAKVRLRPLKPDERRAAMEALELLITARVAQVIRSECQNGAHSDIKPPETETVQKNAPNTPVSQAVAK